MTDHPISANDHTPAIDNHSLWFHIKDRVLLIAGVIAVIGLVILILGTANSGQIEIKKQGNLADIVGVKNAINLGEEHRLQARLVVYGQRIKVTDYNFLRRFQDQTRDVGIIVIVHPGDTVKKRWWQWRYTPAASR